MLKPRTCLLAILMVIAVARELTAAETPDRAEQEKIEFFERHIRPILVDNCYTCHSADTNTKGGLRVDDRNGLLQGGVSGAAVIPGDPVNSLLIRAVQHVDADLKMPPKKQLSADQIAALTQWIADGAAWPSLELPHDLGSMEAEYSSLRKTHWAWQPLTSPKTPTVSKVDWPQGVIDYFVLAKLEEAGLAPVRDASKIELVRRVIFDLTGLPPRPADVAEFVENPSATAYEELVDRLLASPAFGERWGRHWLDIARYAESSGPSRNMPYPHAWRYRDYVIDAFNSDKPYDEFIAEQVAGDLLPAVSQEERDEHLIATGFLAIGGKDVNQRFQIRFMMDNVDEQIDTVSRSILALTASCARCHDHKFDPIPTTDYYALAGIFQSTDICAAMRSQMGGAGYDYYATDLLLPLGKVETPTPEFLAQIETKKKLLGKARSELVAFRDDPDSLKAKGPDGEKAIKAARKKIDEIQSEIIDLTDPAARGPVAIGVRDSKQIADTQVRIRGEAEKLGPTVPRGFLSVVQFPDQPQVGSQQSGRLELARWLTSPQNPLTPRVIVNRVWRHLFGNGIVVSVDNFGITGDSPTHPELLDHLAGQFIRDSWSMKKLIRQIVLSRTYRLSSQVSERQHSVDPGNRWLWRHLPRRLDAEELRDAMLAASDRLKLDRPAGSPADSLPVVELRDTDEPARRLLAFAQASLHRSVYLPLLRGLTPRPLSVFDFPEHGLVTGDRNTTTVATQALYLLNDPFVRTESQHLARRLLADQSLSDLARIDTLYRSALGRSATVSEQRRALRFLVNCELAFVRDRYKHPAELIMVADATPTPSAASDTTQAVASPSGQRPVVSSVANPDNIDRSTEFAAGNVPLPTDSREVAWSNLCQAILASAEFRYLQ